MAVTRLEFPEYFCLDCWCVHPRRNVLVHHDASPADLDAE